MHARGARRTVTCWHHDKAASVEALGRRLNSKASSCLSLGMLPPALLLTSASSSFPCCSTPWSMSDSDVARLSSGSIGDMTASG